MRAITIVRPFRCIRAELDGKVIYFDRVKDPKKYYDVQWGAGISTFDRFDEFGVVENIQFFYFDRFVNMVTSYKGVKEACEHIRSIENKEERNFYKSTRLPSVFWGTFQLKQDEKNGRKSYQITDDGMMCHSGIICIDIDNIAPDMMTVAANRIDKDPYTLMRFLSPSGNGYKVLMNCDDDICGGLHAEYYAAAIRYWRGALPAFGVDSSCKNPSRRCYLSHDPNPYVNKECAPWTEREEVSGGFSDEDISAREVGEGDLDDLFSVCVYRVTNGWRTKKYTDENGEVKKKQIQEGGLSWAPGQKHYFLTALTGMCSKSGMTYAQFERVAKKYLIDERAVMTATAIFNYKK